MHLLSNGRYHVDGHQRRRRLQPLEATWPSPAGARTPRATTAGMFCYLRDVDSGDVLVDRLSADAAAAPSVTRRSSRRPAPSSAAAMSDIDIAHRDRRLAGRRHRAAPRHASPTARARTAHDRTDQLCRSRAGAAGGRRGASGLQQSVRADRDPAATAQAILCTRRPRSDRANSRPGCST